MTNYEKIMSDMTVKKLANFMATHLENCYRCPLEINGCCDYHTFCADNIKDWLESEAETK